MSGEPRRRGTNQFPNPPIKIGITAKKIIMKAWAVTMALYRCPSFKYVPGVPSSIRIIALRAVPIMAAQAPKIKYKVPISLWFVE